MATETVAEEAEPKKEKTEKVKDLEKSLKDVEAKQARENKALERVKAKLKEIVDPTPEEEDPADPHPKPKKDLSAF